MGFLHAGVCYATYDEAMSVKFGADPVLITTSNSVDKLHFFEMFNGAWHWSEYTTTGGAWTLAYHSPMVTIGFPACTPSISPFDPLTAGAFFSFALVSVVFIWLMAKQSGEIVNAIKRW